MKKVYLLMTLALASLMAVGCMKDNEEEGSVDKLSNLILKNVSFGSPTKMHLDPQTYNRLLYDVNDKICVNGNEFTLTKVTDAQGEHWTANGSETQNINDYFYIHYSDGIMNNFSTDGKTCFFNIINQVANYSSNSYTIRDNPSSGIVLAGKTNNRVVTLKPCCAIIRLDTTNVFDNVLVGFDYNTHSSNNKVVKFGIIDADEGEISTSYSELTKVSSAGGEFLQMKYSSDGGFYYVGVPLLGDSINTKIHFIAFNSNGTIKQITENYVGIKKGVVYSVKLKNGDYVSTFDEEGALAHGVFTINDNGGKVKFSRGLLQYRVLNNRWQFAENQYTSMREANAYIGESNQMPIDLFGWATSGKHSSSTAYSPLSTSTNNSDYYNGDMTGNYDWGSNQIYVSTSHQSAYNWRTLTQSEWNHLLNRSNGSKWALATVNNISGVILLPDNFTRPTNLSFVPGGANGYSTNTYAGDNWEYMEQAGAVFMPCTGYRSGSSIFNYQGNTIMGCYWASTSYPYSGILGYYIQFAANSTILNANSLGPKSNGYAVRLVTNTSN